MVDRLSGPSSTRSSPIDAAPNGDAALQGDGVTAGLLLRALRANLPLFLVIAGATLAVTFLLIAASPSQYTAKAAIRMASERRTLTSGVEDAPQTLDRPVDPLLSAVQVLTSRTLVGAVVDTLGLRLQPVVRFNPGLPLFGRRLPAGSFRNVAVVPGSPVDTMLFRFTPMGVVAQSRGGSSEATFGAILRLGAVQVTVAEPPPIGYTMAVVQPLDVTIDGAIRRLKVVPRPGTDVIDVRYTAADPETAQRFVNHLARLFQSANGRSAQQQARRRREFLGEQLRVTDSLLLKAEATLSAFRSRQHMASSQDNLSAEQAAASALEARKTDLVSERRVFAALLERVKNGPPASEPGFQALAYSPEVAADPVLGQLQQRLVSYRTRLDSLTTGPWRSIATNPDVVQLSALVESTQTELLHAVKARLTSIDARIQILANERARGAQLMQGLPAQQAEEAGLGRRVDVLRNTTDALRQEYQKARISEALGAADIEILDHASLPYRRAGIPRSVQLVLGLFIGFLLGGAAALLAEAANRSVRRPEELSSLGDAVELAVIPRIAQLNGGSPRPLLNGKVVNDKVEKGNGQASEVLFGATGALSAEAEAFRLLRISLAFSWGEQPCTLVVTSAAPQEGKTLIATNLAATFARGGARVLLVDCDIHRPRLHKVFHTTRAPGLMDLLRLTGVPSDVRTTVSHRLAAVRRTPIDRLSFLPCGADAQSTPELLEPATLRGLLHDLRTEFDVILLDTPPVLVSADAATLAASADGVIMVLRAGQTDRGAAEVARQRVTSAGGRVLGVVLNDPDGVTERFGKPDYAYDYPATVD